MLSYKNEFAQYTTANRTIKDVSTEAVCLQAGLVSIYGSTEQALVEAKARLATAKLQHDNDFAVCVLNRVIRKLSEQC